MSNSILMPVEGNIELTLEKKLVPKTFFKTRKGLYVYSDFVERISNKSNTSDKGKTNFAVKNVV